MTEDKVKPAVQISDNRQNQSITASDSDIINQVINGHINAFESLIIRYGDIVLRIIKKHVPYNEIEDVTQNAFLRIYKSLPMYRGTGDFKSWLSSITVRTCYDYWRKAYKSHEVPMNSITGNQQKWLEDMVSDESENPPDDRCNKKEAAELLEWALGRLSPEDRMVLELVYLEGYSGREVAELLGWSVSNVKVRSFRLKIKLKSILKAALKKGIGG